MILNWYLWVQLSYLNSNQVLVMAVQNKTHKSCIYWKVLTTPGSWNWRKRFVIEGLARPKIVTEAVINRKTFVSFFATILEKNSRISNGAVQKKYRWQVITCSWTHDSKESRFSLLGPAMNIAWPQSLANLLFNVMFFVMHKMSRKQESPQNSETFGRKKTREDQWDLLGRLPKLSGKNWVLELECEIDQ